jgi:hypothetical protein
LTTTVSSLSTEEFSDLPKKITFFLLKKFMEMLVEYSLIVRITVQNVGQDGVPDTAILYELDGPRIESQ